MLIAAGIGTKVYSMSWLVMTKCLGCMWMKSIIWQPLIGWTKNHLKWTLVFLFLVFVSNDEIKKLASLIYFSRVLMDPRVFLLHFFLLPSRRSRRQAAENVMEEFTKTGFCYCFVFFLFWFFPFHIIFFPYGLDPLVYTGCLQKVYFMHLLSFHSPKHFSWEAWKRTWNWMTITDRSDVTSVSNCVRGVAEEVSHKLLYQGCKKRQGG